MKKKTKIVIVTAAVAITSLMITVFHPEPVSSPVSPQIAPVSDFVAVSRAYTPPMATEPIVVEEIIEISTQTEEITEPTHQQEVIVAEYETPTPQPTEKEESTNTPTPTTQTATKPTAPPAPISEEPKMGDTRIIDGKKQSYFLGFGWVDDMGENEVVYCEGMYENGNKIGIMDSDGDINKMVGIMD